ncbi:MAG: EamA family transporter [Methylophaga sp.]|nr:EamA family transporter [Methylophaga sp.]
MSRLNTIFVALAALFWGISAGIAAILMNEGWHPFVVSFYRGSIGLLFVLVWLALRPQKSGLANRRLWFWSVIAGLGVAGNFAFYFISIAEGSVAVAATLMYCAPIFVYLVSFMVGLETPSSLKWAAIIVVMIGIVLLTQIYDIGPDGITPIGVGAGLLAGMSYAVFIFGFKFASPHGSSQMILAIALTVLASILIWPSDFEQVIAVPASPEWSLFIILGMLGAGLSFVIYIFGLKYTAPAIASIMAMVEPVTASLFGVLILGETLTIMQILGMGMILFSVTALSVYSGIRMRT